MMRLIKNSEPVVHKHNCAMARRGKEMTSEELHDFAVEVLMSEYAETGTATFRYDIAMAGRADFWFSDSLHQKVNVLVVYDDELSESHPSVDSTWMLDEYRQNGAIPRVTVASAWCFGDTNYDGKPALCGGDFCFQFYPISLLPDKENAPLDKVFSPIELASKFAQTWNNLDASIVAPYLDKDFHYSSDWVYDELPSRAEYLRYFQAKLNTLKRRGSKVYAEVARSLLTEEVAVLLRQGNITCILTLQTRDGRITAARMMDYDDVGYNVNTLQGGTDANITLENSKDIKGHSCNYSEQISHTTSPEELRTFCSEFRDFMNNYDLSKAENLMSVLQRLPLLEIKQGYELNAFIVHSYHYIHSYKYQVYCCKEKSKDRYFSWGLINFLSGLCHLSIHLRYTDSQYISGTLWERAAKRIPPALPYFDVPFTKEGIMQAWLLNNLSKFISATNSNKVSEFVFAQEDIKHLLDSQTHTNILQNQEAIKLEELIPTIEIDGDRAIIKYSTWDSYNGLNSNTEKVMKVGNKVRFYDHKKTILAGFLRLIIGHK